MYMVPFPQATGTCNAALNMATNSDKTQTPETKPASILLKPSPPTAVQSLKQLLILVENRLTILNHVAALH